MVCGDGFQNAHNIVHLLVYKMNLNVLNIVSILRGESVNTTYNLTNLWLTFYWHAGFRCLCFITIWSGWKLYSLTCISKTYHLTAIDMLLTSHWQEEWSLWVITGTVLFPDLAFYLLGATSPTFYSLAGQISKWLFCQPFHVMKTSRLPQLPNTENVICNSPKVISVLTQLWPMTCTEARESLDTCPGKIHTF